MRGGFANASTLLADELLCAGQGNYYERLTASGLPGGGTDAVDGC
jgi:hypothetical protein